MARKINSLFGVLEINNEGKITQTNPNDFLYGTSDFILRKSGIGKKKQALGRALTALADPETYLQDKNADLSSIAEKLQESFSNKYEKKIAEGYYSEEAEKLAWKEIKEKQAQLMDEHRRNFPTQIKGEDSMKLIQTKNKNPIF